MKVIIAGSRNIDDEKGVFRLLDNYYEDAIEKKITITEVVSGGASGVDKIGENWALSKGIPVKKFLPDWSVGKKAGPIRNAKMAEYGDVLVAIWDSNSRGTKNMIDCMKRLGKPVYTFHWNIFFITP